MDLFRKIMKTSTANNSATNSAEKSGDNDEDEIVSALAALKRRHENPSAHSALCFNQLKRRLGLSKYLSNAGWDTFRSFACDGSGSRSYDEAVVAADLRAREVVSKDRWLKPKIEETLSKAYGRLLVNWNALMQKQKEAEKLKKKNLKALKKKSKLDRIRI